jgi:hypothetical protein
MSDMAMEMHAVVVDGKWHIETLVGFRSRTTGRIDGSSGLHPVRHVAEDNDLAYAILLAYEFANNQMTTLKALSNARLQS